MLDEIGKHRRSDRWTTIEFAAGTGRAQNAKSVQIGGPHAQVTGTNVERSVTESGFQGSFVDQLNFIVWLSIGEKSTKQKKQNWITIYLELYDTFKRDVRDHLTFMDYTDDYK
jgi:hypothetical protein